MSYQPGDGGTDHFPPQPPHDPSSAYQPPADAHSSQPGYSPAPQYGSQPQPAYGTPSSHPGAHTPGYGAHPGHPAGDSDKSFLVTWLLAYFLGSFGADRFYLGKIGTAIAKLLTAGGLGIWALVDLIMVLVGATRDKQGRPLAGYQQHKKTAWIVTAILVALGFVIGIIMGVAGLFGAQSASTVRPADEPASQSAPEDPADSALEEEPPAVEEADAEEESAAETEDADSSGTDFASWADGAFGTFDPVTETGSGDTVIDMPAGASGVLITAKYSGDGNFIIQGLDESNEISGALPVNTIGTYEGTTFVSADGWDATSKLQVTATGTFEITLSPVSKAAAFSESGSGDTVMQYTEGAATVSFTHDGESNFVVHENSGSDFGPDLLINEIGSYDGSVPLRSGPSILIVQADGSWTASAS